MRFRSPPFVWTVSTAVAVGSSLFALIACVSTFVGWRFDMPRLTDWFDQGISMFPNAAACGVGCAVAVLLLVAPPRRGAITITRVLIAGTLLLSSLTLCEHALRVDLGVDRLILIRNWGQTAAAAPMRMGVPASTSYLFLGAALLLLTHGGAARRWAAATAMVPLFIASLSLTGYWFGADQLFGIAAYSGIALLTSLVIFGLSIGVIACIPEHGLAAALRRDDPGGALLRRLLVPIIVVPLLLGWLRLIGQSAGLYDLEFGTALRTIIEIGLFFVLLWWTAHKISRHASSADAAQARLAAIIESTDDAVVSKSLDGMVQSWNAGAEAVFGYTAAEMIGRPITTIIPPERIDEESEILSRLRRGERIEHFETVRMRKDGARIAVAITVSPIRDAAGRVIGASKIARDITDRRRTEERLRAVIEATPECVKIVNPDGSLEYMNHAGLCMIESESEPAVRGASVFDLIAPEHREVWRENHKRVCAGEKLNWEFEIVGLKGARRWMETHAVPLRLPDGRVAQLAVTREVTDRKRMEREREDLLESERAARNDAERAGRIKDEFLATLSHELRTPLNAVLGWAQLLNLSEQSPEVREGLEAIERNARAQAQLIEDLLDMSRIISGKVRIDVQQVDLAGVVEAAISSCRPAADAKGINLRSILASHAGFVAGDPTRLQQVFWNLLNNAIKFTPKGGKVDVILDRPDSHFEVTVRDTGVGIKAADLPIIFERFRQVDSSTTRSHGGLGLGLSIVKHLIELHGGTVTAHSEGEGRGTSFTVRLPLSPLRTDEARTPRSDVRQGPPPFGPNDLAGAKVLVVDDEPDARSLVQRVFSQCGAEVCTAGSAAEALERLRSFRPDVLVSDIGMPVADGYELIRAVRRLGDHEGGRTPAVALTAFARSEDRVRAILAGYQVHVAKPIEPHELVVTVQSLYRGR